MTSLRPFGLCIELIYILAMDSNDLDDDAPQLVDVSAPALTEVERPMSPSELKFPRVPITIVTGMYIFD